MEASLVKEYEEGRRVGIKEVVAWIEKHKLLASPWNFYQFSEKEWQAKLKEWEIE